MSWTFSYINPSSLSAGDLTILDGLGVFSCHIWSRLTYTSGDGHAIGKHDGTNGLRLYYDQTATNGKTEAPKLLVTIGGTSVRAEPDENGLFTANEWHSFGGQWKPNDASGIKVWFDGVNKCTGSTTSHGPGTTFPDLAASLYLGRQASSPSVGWSGQLSEAGIWDEWLDEDDWKALAQGVPAYMVRPWALIFFAPMKQPSSGTEWYWLPKAGTTADLSHTSTTYSTEEPPLADPWTVQAQEQEFASTSSPVYSSWAKVKEVSSSYYLDTGLANGTEYQYYLVAVDTSNNPSTASTTQSVTPAAGVQGPPLVIPYSQARKRIPAQRDAEDDEIL